MSSEVSCHFYWLQCAERVVSSQSEAKILKRYPNAQLNRVLVNNTTDWQQLAQEITLPDLFAGQRLWRFNFTEQTPDARALEFTRKLSNELKLDLQTEPDIIVVYSSEILKSAQRKSQWFTRLKQSGDIKLMWPMNDSKRLDWVKRQMRHHAVNLDDSALNYLISLCEGNLTLLDAELYKLSLFNIDQQKIMNFTLRDLQEKIEGDFSRFDPFKVVGTALLKPMSQFIKMIAYFENEGHEIHRLLGVMRFSLNQLIGLSSDAQGDLSSSGHMRYLPPDQKGIVQACLARYNNDRLVDILLSLSEVEKSARGINRLSPWVQLKSWAINLRSTR